MSILLISDQMMEPQDTSPSVEQDSTKSVRLLLNRCVSFSLNSSPTLKRHRSNLIADPLPKDNFTIHVGSQAHSKKKFLDPKTFDTFVKNEETEKDFSSSPKSSNKDTSSLSIQKGILSNKNQENKRNKSTGKMYVNELWSKKHYYEIVNSSDLAKQQEEIIKKIFQTTEERAHEINERCRAKLEPKSPQGKFLLEKYQKRELITEEDLSLKSDLDPQFVAEKKRLSIRKSRTRLLRRSGIEDIKSCIKEEEYTTQGLRHQKKKPNTILLPSLEKNSPTFGKCDAQFLRFKGHAASTNTSPNMNRLFASRHLTSIRPRGQYNESELKTTTDCSPTGASLGSSKIFQSIGGISFQNDNDFESTTATNPISESRMSLIKLVQNCKQFNNDKTAMKLVDNISYNFGPNKYLKDAKDQREKREKLKKKSLLEVCVHNHQERKKKEKSLYEL